MKHTRKMSLTPFELDQFGGQITVEPSFDQEMDHPTSLNATSEPVKKKGNWIRDRAFERYRKLIEITYILSKYNAFNEKYQIKLRSGGHLAGSDGIALLMHILSPGKSMVGLQEFVELLADAGVTADMVINENVKAMLRDLQPRKSFADKGTSYEPSGSMSFNDQECNTTVRPMLSIKRKIAPSGNSSSQTEKHVSFDLNSDPAVSNEEEDEETSPPPLKKIRHTSILRPSKLNLPMPTLSTYDKPQNWSLNDSESDTDG